MTPSPPPMPRIVREPPPGPVLVIAPHPDDEIIGPGGTLLLHARRGDAIAVVVVFDGANGDPDGLFPRDGYRERRRDETARTVSDFLGSDDVTFHGFADGLGEEDLGLVYGDLPAEPEARRGALLDGLASHLRAHVQRIAPRCVYAPWPGEKHPDHWACGVAMQALVRHEPELFAGVEVLGYEVWTTLVPELLVDVSDTMADKLAAIARYETQTAYADYPTLVDGLNRHRGALMPDAAAEKSRRRAEAFVSLRTAGSAS